MERMSWKDGWHKTDRFSFYIENGIFVRGLTNDGKTIYPYIRKKPWLVDFERVYNMKANKRNSEKIYWF